MGIVENLVLVMIYILMWALVTQPSSVCNNPFNLYACDLYRLCIYQSVLKLCHSNTKEYDHVFKKILSINNDI